MKTIEVPQGPGTLEQFVGALRASRKRPGAVKKLPALTLVRPQVVVDADHVARYAQVCGFQSTHGVPLIYPQMLTFPLVMAWMGSDDCPWPALGTVHLANAITQHQRLHAGDTVRVELRTGQLFAHDKGQGFTLELGLWRNDSLVWEATQSLLRVGVSSPTGAPFESRIHAATALSHQADFVAASDIGRRYAAVSGDRNPIHLSALSAKLFGFRRAIAHGMWTQARALACLLPVAPLEHADLAVDFKTPLYLPARASLWSARRRDGALFEVRDAKGERPHLRAQLRH